MKVILLIIILILLYIFINEIWLKETPDKNFNNRNLDDDGYIVFNNIKNKKTILKYLPDNYVFLNYKYTIKGCSLSTFHRDVTSSHYIFKTNYPVYTYIIYNNNKGPLLSVCPGSHKTVPYLSSRPKTIIGNNNNTSVLFNCDLVHAGAINDLGNTRYAEQFKIAHVKDLDKLKHLDKKNTKKIGKCEISLIYEIISRKVSLLFSHIINHHLTKYLQENDKSFLNKIGLYLYGREFYN